jgi:DNA invertase Pin-like site-specific DNA recombinase
LCDTPVSQSSAYEHRLRRRRPIERKEMPPTTDVLDEFRDRLRARREELLEELREIEQHLGIGGKSRGGRRPGRPRGSGSKSASAGSRSGGATRRRRRRKGGTRADQAVKLVEGNPGVSAAEIAKQMKIKPNYLYRVLGELEKEGRVTKKGREYHPGGKGS